jgi:hypothetical protein
MATPENSKSLIDCQCRWCGDHFGATPSAARRGRGQFCSRDCSCAHNRHRRWKIMKVPSAPRPKTPIEERYERHVIRRGDDECWAWSAFKHRGYGRIDDGNGRSVGAHRVSYEMHVGPIPPGMLVCHRCDNPECTNPRHLFLGTIIDNNLDRDQKGRTCLGQSNPQAKLTSQAVREIRVSLKQDRSRRRALAERFGVQPRAIQNAADRKTWRHVR